MPKELYYELIENLSRIIMSVHPQEPMGYVETTRQIDHDINEYMIEFGKKYIYNKE